jgi:hypothetical protein
VRQIHSYVVRFYRRDAEGVAGVVEDVERSRRVPFRSFAELCDLLCGRKPFPRRTAPPSTEESY